MKRKSATVDNKATLAPAHFETAKLVVTGSDSTAEIEASTATSRISTGAAERTVFADDGSNETFTGRRDGASVIPLPTVTVGNVGDGAAATTDNGSVVTTGESAGNRVTGDSVVSGVIGIFVSIFCEAVGGRAIGAFVEATGESVGWIIGVSVTVTGEFVGWAVG